MLQLGSSQSAGKAAGIQSVLLHRFDVPAAKANSAKMGPVEEKHTELHDSSYLVALNQESEKVVKTSPARNLAAAKKRSCRKESCRKESWRKESCSRESCGKKQSRRKEGESSAANSYKEEDRQTKVSENEEACCKC
jgi:hypothetical protein